MHSLIDTHNFSLSFAAKKIGGGAETKKVPVSQHSVFFFSHFLLLSFSNNVKQALNSFTRERGCSIYLQFQKKISYFLLKLTLLSLSWCIMKNIVCRKSGESLKRFSMFLPFACYRFQGFFFSFFTINSFLIELCKILICFWQSSRSKHSLSFFFIRNMVKTKYTF